MRIGHGYDVHAFGKGDHIIIGGVKIPFKHGLLAHSDGDVLIHSLCDALLGAAALGDIGTHFSDTDPSFLNISSRKLLGTVITLVENKGYHVLNADVTIIAEEPKLAAYIDIMVKNLSSDLRCNADNINVKATTTENLGFEGRGEGIACHTVVLIQ
ncbi:MAG: 2-C-methyl-D-erythritol 2,4-cyclodiphosphate synthase [Porticoccus sp.]|jgi:2-C-methyl-D-erythritol 2,4-cyclodiphosphate synthase|nr:2-C-methyl-D-erythritol 2,4-cyclodiphosphate synthase [Porticoccus sp.]|tara:strand:- start:280 stop:747 length:468 start_codon:yes stop_codon:yes gene_type:complete